MPLKAVIVILLYFRTILLNRSLASLDISVIIANVGEMTCPTAWEMKERVDVGKVLMSEHHQSMIDEPI